MMYEALLFDMNALGDIPDKDFTSRAVCAGSSPVEGGGQRQRSPDPPQAGLQGLRRRPPAMVREAEPRSLLPSNFWILSPSGSSHPYKEQSVDSGSHLPKVSEWPGSWLETQGPGSHPGSTKRGLGICLVRAVPSVNRTAGPGPKRGPKKRCGV